MPKPGTSVVLVCCGYVVGIITIYLLGAGFWAAYLTVPAWLMLVNLTDYLPGSPAGIIFSPAASIVMVTMSAVVNATGLYLLVWAARRLFRG